MKKINNLINQVKPYYNSKKKKLPNASPSENHSACKSLLSPGTKYSPYQPACTQAVAFDLQLTLSILSRLLQTAKLSESANVKGESSDAWIFGKGPKTTRHQEELEPLQVRIFREKKTRFRSIDDNRNYIYTPIPVCI